MLTPKEYEKMKEEKKLFIDENFAQVAGEIAELDNKVTELSTHVIMLVEALRFFLDAMTPRAWNDTRKITEKINES